MPTHPFDPNLLRQWAPPVLGFATRPLGSRGLYVRQFAWGQAGATTAVAVPFVYNPRPGNAILTFVAYRVGATLSMDGGPTGVSSWRTLYALNSTPSLAAFLGIVTGETKSYTGRTGGGASDTITMAIVELGGAFGVLEAVANVASAGQCAVTPGNPALVFNFLTHSAGSAQSSISTPSGSLLSLQMTAFGSLAYTGRPILGVATPNQGWVNTNTNPQQVTVAIR